MADFSAIKNMVKAAEQHADNQSADRIRATEYYRGEMKDVPSDKGRSRMATRDVRAHIKKVLPSIVRTLLNSDELVEFMPVGPGDEEYAQQASDFVNYIVLPETDGRTAIYDAIHDALLLRNGILKWWREEKQTVKISKHSGLPDDAFAMLAADDSVEVLEHTARQETVSDATGQEMPITVHDAKIRRTAVERCTKLAAVPRERFLIHPDAIDIGDSILTGEKCELTRSDLIAMGYDAKLINDLPMAGEDEYEESVRRDLVHSDDEATRANEPVDYYDMYVRIDMDGDGIAELRHMCFAGGLNEKNLLVDDECDAVQFADLCIMRNPHQWEGTSLADDLMDLQQAKTVLLRQTVDNLYWQNNPQPIMQRGAVLNPDAVFNPEFGKPIELGTGYAARDAISFNQVPFVAAQSFGMLEYLDGEATDRTGVTDASAGMAPDALQNMTAKASAMIEQQGIGQTELMVRTLADGLRRVFRGLLRLTVQHQDVPRTVRLRDEWVTFDPRQWNADMDCTVNTGLGAGTRERDMAMMQAVMGIQQQIIGAFGPDNPFVKPDNLSNTLKKLVEAAGLKTASLYFTEPDPQEVQQRLEALRNAPNPEQMKMQGQMQLEQAKMQAQMQMEQAKMQIEAEAKKLEIAASRDKEAAQMQADLQVEQARAEAKSRETAEALQADALKEAQRLAFEREKLAAEQQMKREEWAVQVQLAAIKAHQEVGATAGAPALMQLSQALRGAPDAPR